MTRLRAYLAWALFGAPRPDNAARDNERALRFAGRRRVEP